MDGCRKRPAASRGPLMDIGCGRAGRERRYRVTACPPFAAVGPSCSRLSTQSQATRRAETLVPGQRRPIDRRSCEGTGMGGEELPTKAHRRRASASCAALLETTSQRHKSAGRLRPSFCNLVRIDLRPGHGHALFMRLSLAGKAHRIDESLRARAAGAQHRDGDVNPRRRTPTTMRKTNRTLCTGSACWPRVSSFCEPR